MAVSYEGNSIEESMYVRACAACSRVEMIHDRKTKLAVEKDLMCMCVCVCARTFMFNILRVRRSRNVSCTRYIR